MKDFALSMYMENYSSGLTNFDLFICITKKVQVYIFVWLSKCRLTYLYVLRKAHNS